jgi:hypothetical protein
MVGGNITVSVAGALVTAPIKLVTTTVYVPAAAAWTFVNSSR